MAIRLFQSQTSMFCEKVRVVFALKKVPYEIVDVRKDERKSLIEFTGQRKVPTMDYNGKSVIDSTVISALLEKDYPANSVYPDGAAANGLCLALEDWSDEVLIHANHAMRRAETPDARKKAEEQWATHFNALEQMYSGKKFIFDRMTIADIAIFSQLHYLYTTVKYEIPANYKNVLAFMENMRQTLKLNSLADSFAAQSL
ncbi:MAG: glutathione S-transferase family protein [Deltaproteobacteria bacterium]|nr:glutathione S-transferase family protein [Deltaproteobacteria bacterium]MDZ4347378.1 glutathione S-transferase family protein [Candidatus Binatia bacterium]